MDETECGVRPKEKELQFLKAAILDKYRSTG